jgi:hypothetical protein
MMSQMPDERFDQVSSILDQIKPDTAGADLEARGMDELHAADLRKRLTTFAEDWNRSEADIYDEDPPW